MMMDPKKQIEIIKEGCAELIPESELLGKLSKKKQLRVKWGADPSAPDIHLGHIVIIRKLRTFQELGHKVIFIIGDFTGMIGDPSGKSETRVSLSRKDVEKNARTYKEQVFKILDPRKTEIVYNSKWLSKLTLEEVIGLAAKYTVARMLERDDFIKRYSEQKPISIHEFLYPLIQGYDSVMVKADIEIGGTDQKFNLLVGRELQREFKEDPQVIMTMPLLEGIDGVQKMSKSLGNYIGIAEPPNEMFGKVMSIPDDVMPQYFELATEVPLPEVREIEEGLAGGKLHPMEAKKRLAREIVTIYHGAEAAGEAQAEFERVFSAHELPSEMPSICVPRSAIKDGKVWIVRLITIAGFAASNGEARRLVEQGAVTLDGERITDVNAELPIKDGQILHVGKLKYGRIVIE